MKPSHAAVLLEKLIPAHEPLLLVGSPGVGKTSLIEQATTALGIDLKVWHPVVSDPTDYKGMPAVISAGDTSTAEFLPFGDLREILMADRETVVAFDDLGQALPATQAAIMQLVLARQINGHRISKKVQFLAATNRRQDQAGVVGLITPLLDRFTTVLNIDFDLEDWIKWGLKQDLPPILFAFARFKPDAIGKFEPSRDMKKSPTPRSVAGLGRLVRRGIYESEVLAGAVGEGFAGEFLAFYRTWRDLPSLKDVYENPTTIKVPTSADVLYALMGALAHGAKVETLDPTTQFLERVPAEFAVLCIKDALSRDEALKTTPQVARWVNKHSRIFSGS